LLFLHHFLDPFHPRFGKALAALNATLYAVFATSVRKVLALRRAQRRFNFVGGTLLSSAGIWALLAKRPL
tara:strand:- start:225 stop:434 length:210 start_codon:yes stop_codon:yes gene_type:complete